MKKLVMLVAALMAVAFVGLNYESTAYANDRAILSIGVSGGTGSISVVWTTPTEAPYDYRLAWGLNGGYISYKASNTSTAGNAYPGGSVTSYTITGLDPGTYSVKLRARYDGSAGPWEAASSVVVTGDAPPVVVVVPDPTAEPEPPTSEQQQADPPAAPTGLTASQVAHDSVTLTWTAPSSVSTVTGYKVLRGAGTNSLSAIAQDTGSTSTEYTDSTVGAETTYHYAVLALSQDGDGAQSAALSVTTQAAPGSKKGENKPPPKRVTRQTAQTTITLVSNTGKSTSGNRSPDTKDLAQSFDTGPVSGGYNLASIVLDFSSTPGSSTLTVTVRQDDSGSPSSTVLHTLTNPATYTTGLNEFSALPNATLAASTKYWVVASYNSNSGGPGWNRLLLSAGIDSGAATGWEIDDAYKDRGRTSGLVWMVESGTRSLNPNPPMRSGLGVGTRGEGRGTRRSALDSDKWGRWRPLVVVGGADGGPGQRRWGGVGGTACKGRQSRIGPMRLCGVVE